MSHMFNMTQVYYPSLFPLSLNIKLTFQKQPAFKTLEKVLVHTLFTCTQTQLSWTVQSVFTVLQ